MPSLNVNKVVYNGQTLVDLTEDTVTPEELTEGVTAHDASGTPIVGQRSSSISWGNISGTLSNQADLQNALNNKANASHAHGGIEVRPNYIISDVDLEDGISELAAGTLYFYYEA